MSLRAYTNLSFLAKKPDSRVNFLERFFISRIFSGTVTGDAGDARDAGGVSDAGDAGDAGGVSDAGDVVDGGGVSDAGGVGEVLPHKTGFFLFIQVFSI